MSDIFISYARQDRSRAERIEQVLTSSGFDVWWDPHIRTGEAWSDVIEEQLKKARCVVVLWSRHSIASKNVKNEAEIAEARGVLVPILLDPVLADIPLPFRHLEVADLTGWKGDPLDPGFAKLERDISSLLAREPPQRPLIPRPHRSPFRWLPRCMLNHEVSAVLMIAMGGIAGWYLWGRHWLNTRESVLWSAAVLLLGIAGIAAYRWYRGRAAADPPAWSVRRAALPSSLLVAMGAWGSLAFEAYRIPTFPAGIQGIYVARLDGDPRDVYRNAMIEALRDSIANQGLEDLEVIDVLPLPRRIAGDDEARARRLGKRGGAILVLWGKIAVMPDTPEDSLLGRITFVDAAGVFDPLVSRAARGVQGAAILSVLSGMDVRGEFGALQRALPGFLAGYSLYHAGEYARASRYLHTTIQRIEGAGLEANPNRGARTEILASAHFYLGNTYTRLGELDSAKAHYSAAVTHGRHPEEEDWQRYIEPLNNLALLLQQEGRTADAIELLERADRECNRANRGDLYLVCAAAWYNLATSYNESGRYEDALRRFRAAIQRLEKAHSAGTPDSAAAILLAYCYRGMAYSESRRAEGVKQGERTAAYEQAMEHWSRAVEIFPGKAPPDFHITRARALLGLGQWDSALSALREAEREIPEVAEIYLLLAAARICTENPEAGVPDLQKYYRLAASTQWASGDTQLKALTKRCRSLP